MTSFLRLYLLAALLFIASGCFSQQGSSTDQLISGPFKVTDEWQEIHFEKPLETGPHSIYLELMLDQSEFELVKTAIDEQRNILSPYRYQRLSDKEVIEVEVALVHSNGKYNVPYVGNGLRYTKLGDYLYLAYGVDTSKGKAFYPKGVKFTSLSIRANTSVTINHLSWFARYYERQPDRSWDDIKESEIVDLEK